MKLNLVPEATRLVKARLKSGRYASPEDVVLAALQLLMQQPDDQFAAGELRKLLDVADQDIERGNVLDGEQVLREFRVLRARARSKAG